MSFFYLQNSKIDAGKAEVEKANQPIIVVLNYLEENLQAFAKDESLKGILNEKGLTQRLVRQLNINLSDEFPFIFDKEGMEDEATGASAEIDIDVISKELIQVCSKHYKRGGRFFAFETKILGVKENYRQKEYVVGYDKIVNGKLTHINCGGIERFKKGIHGNGLSFAGMIGYVLREGFDFWQGKIDLWINDLINTNIDTTIEWSASDKLVPSGTTNSIIAKFISSNSRIKERNKIAPITLYHLWVNLFQG